MRKKDETEVKQEEKKEEKKEETAKADSSNKSNTSESKKNNTASTNSSSNSSKPAEHTHNWVAQYKTVNVPEKGHNEQVLVQAAYDEQVPIKEMREFAICSACGENLTNMDDAALSNHLYNHMINGENGGYFSDWREVVTGYNTVHHDAVYETRYVVDSPATTKQELTGYKCSSCGKTKAN